MTIRMLHQSVCVAIAMFLSFVMASQANAFATPPSFSVVGDLPGGTYSTTAFAVSSDGQFVGGSSASALGSQAFMWSSLTGIVAVDDLPNAPYYCGMRGISGGGAVAVGYGNYVSTTSAEAMRWVGGAAQGLGLPEGMPCSFAIDVSHDGEVILVNSNTNEGGTFAYLWTEKSGYVPVPVTQADDYQQPYSISGDGKTVVGVCDSPSGIEGFIWSQANGSELIGDLPDGTFYSYARAVSANGSVVVGIGSQAVGSEAIRWTRDSGMQGLGFLTPESTGSGANAVSADGSVVVGTSQITSSNTLSFSRAFIWDQHHGMRQVSDVLAGMGVPLLAGMKLLLGLDISADGRTIVGLGRNAQNQYEGFRVQLGAAGDATYDGAVNVADLLAVIGAWGACPSSTTHCTGDVAPAPLGDTVVNVADLLAVIGAWGS